MVRYDTVPCGTERYGTGTGTVRSCTVRYRTVRYGTCTVRYGTVFKTYQQQDQQQQHHHHNMKIQSMELAFLFAETPVEAAIAPNYTRLPAGKPQHVRADFDFSGSSNNFIPAPHIRTLH